MEIISNSKKLNQVFKKLMEDYKEYYWAVAWASIDFSQYEYLAANKNRIAKTVIGISNSITHPSILEEFSNCENVRFIEQGNGLFHPKLYLFYDSDQKWECLIGSNNFTRPAFTCNTEIAVLISNKDLLADKSIRKIFDSINKLWKQSKPLTTEEILKYRSVWEQKQYKTPRLFHTQHGKSLLKMNWKEYFSIVQDDHYHSIESRLRVLENARSLLENSFKNLETIDRKNIAGVILNRLV